MSASSRKTARLPTRSPVRICAAAASSTICGASHPYLDYEQYDFEVALGSAGDCYDRYLVRIEEMRQSVRILRQVIDKLPAGPINVVDWKNMLPPKAR